MDYFTGSQLVGMLFMFGAGVFVSYAFFRHQSWFKGEDK